MLDNEIINQKLTSGSKCNSYMRLKRVIDIILACCILIVLWPILLIVAMFIKLEEVKGPVIFKQMRVGKDKTTFYIYKFRTMRMDTPVLPTHQLVNPEQYITKIGKFLRKTSIDELPQLINILKGEMSFIGPRPALWTQEDLVSERERYQANDIRPGLSGLAQISGRDELAIAVKAELDGAYVRNMSLKLDFEIFIKTFSRVLHSEGVVEGSKNVTKESDGEGL